LRTGCPSASSRCFGRLAQSAAVTHDLSSFDKKSLRPKIFGNHSRSVSHFYIWYKIPKETYWAQTLFVESYVFITLTLEKSSTITLDYFLCFSINCPQFAKIRPIWSQVIL
jgi:hypothetical protein